MEKEIKFSLSLVKAKEFYNSGNEELKKIALLVYNENILNSIEYDTIINDIFDKGFYYPNTFAINNIDKSISIASPIHSKIGYFSTHDEEFLKYIAVLIKIKNIADYFNQRYDKSDEGYEISNPDVLVKQNHYNILFDSHEDAKKAYELLSEEEKTYLNYLII